MRSHVGRSIRVVALLAIPIAALSCGCNHPLSTPEDAVPTSDEALITLIGRQITVRGRFSLRGKIGPYVMLDNRQTIYLVNRSEWGPPYSEWEGKRVSVTGTLRFYREPPADPSERTTVAHAYDHFYFDAETTAVRLIGH